MSEIIDGFAGGEIAGERAVVAKARKGDMVAARLVLDRIWPAVRGRALKLDLPSVADAAGINAAHTKLLASVADGTLTPEEALAVFGLLTDEASPRLI